MESGRRGKSPPWMVADGFSTDNYRLIYHMQIGLNVYLEFDLED